VITYSIRSAVSLTLAFLALATSSFAFAEPITLQLRWHHQAQFIGYYIAKEKGFYSSLNMDVTILEGKPDTPPWQQVAAGEADFAVDNSNAFLAYLQGADLVALAAVIQHSPSAFLVKQSSGIHSPKDFEGKRVMSFSQNQDPELVTLLKHESVNLDNIEWSSSSGDLNDLIEDKVDAFNAYTSNEPYTMQQLGIPYNLITPRQYGIDFYSDLLVTTHSFAEHNPDLVDKFLSASLEGWRYALANPDEAIQILHEKYQPTKTIEHLRYEFNLTRENIMPDLISIGHLNPMRLNHIRDLVTEYGLIENSRDVSSFIYDTKNLIRWSNWLPLIYILVAVLLILFVFSFYLISLNRKLKSEIRHRIYTEDQLKYMASHDPLTGLANRSALTSKLDMIVSLAKRNSETPAILYIDLDGFKEINDTLGHASGDQVLTRFARRTLTILRESDVFARLGGDEFVIIMPHADRPGAHHLARKVLQHLNTPFKLRSGDHKISASIGIAIYDNYEETGDQFLIRADHAMYHIKRSGKSGISLAPTFKRNEPNPQMSCA
jgi:diguanylate cyclase (GGDEF)-like protein